VEKSGALQEVLDDARRRFVATFASQCDAISALVDERAASGAIESSAGLTHITHRLSGLAGTIGFPTISARASELEALLEGADGAAFDAVLARAHLRAIREAFVTDSAGAVACVPAAVAANARRDDPRRRG
jgi:HPt (histidine-containing phosphotransfer) domain-containing protein